MEVLSSTDTSDYLAHYGVLGMKWGVRRSRSYSNKAAKYRAKAKTQELNGKKGSAVKSRQIANAYSDASKFMAKNSKKGGAVAVRSNAYTMQGIRITKRYAGELLSSAKAKKAFAKNQKGKDFIENHPTIINSSWNGYLAGNIVAGPIGGLAGYGVGNLVGRAIEKKRS